MMQHLLFQGRAIPSTEAWGMGVEILQCRIIIEGRLSMLPTRVPLLLPGMNQSK